MKRFRCKTADCGINNETEACVIVVPDYAEPPTRCPYGPDFTADEEARVEWEKLDRL